MALTDTWRSLLGLPPATGNPWDAADGSLRLARVTVALLVGALIAPVLTVSVLALVLLGLPLSATLPEERTPLESRITRVYDADGVEMAVFRRFETALPMQPEDIPRVLEDAVVASEDRRFYQHRGVDSRGLLRALRADASAGEYEQGASTITQQLVRLAYTNDTSRTLDRKLREAVLARELESRLGKDEILFRYLARVYLGGGNYGAAAAARSYFHKPLAEIDLSEAALLAGLIPAPSVLEPLLNPSGAEAGRRRVLQAMAEEGMITQAELDRELPRAVTVVREGVPPPGPATAVHRPELPVVRHPFFSDYVRRYLIARFGEDEVYTGGLRVETSFDPDLQAAAEAAVASTLEGTPEGLEMALVAVEPSTGFVRALVGGRDFDDSNVNLALGDCDHVEPVAEGPVCVAGGGGGRQPGSAFKPVTLAAALASGKRPTDTYRGPGTYTYPGCAGAGCTVRNTESGSYGTLTLAQATAYSVNTVFAQLVLDVGIQETAEMANRLGLTMIDPEGNLPSGEPYGPSLTLGAAEVSPLDMAAAFGVFAARGQQYPATPIVRITGPDGRVVEDNRRRLPERVLSPSVADEINAALSGVIQFGTGRAAAIDREGGMAGKTGTSEEFADAWFVGYTPELSTAVWMGYAESRTAMENIKGVPRVYGGTLPAATWKEFMTVALEGVPASTFPRPPRLTRPTPAAPSSPASDDLPGAPPGGAGTTVPAATVPPGTVPPGTVPPGTVPAGTRPPSAVVPDGGPTPPTEPAPGEPVPIELTAEPLGPSVVGIPVQPGP